MKIISLIISILIFTFANNILAQTNKTYLQLSAKEQSEFIAAKLAELPLMKALNLQINDSAINQIKFFVDKYAKRVNTKKLSRCGFGDNLQATFERAAKMRR